MGSHESEMVNKPRHFVSISMRVQGAMYAALFMALSGTRLNKGFLDIFSHLKFYVDWLVLIGLNLALIWFVIFATDWEDKRTKWKKEPEKRFCIQVIFIFLFPYFTCEFLNISYQNVVGRDLFRSPYGLFEIPTCFTFLMVLNLAYPFAKYVIGGQKKEEKNDAEIQSASMLSEKILQSPIESVKNTVSSDEKIENNIVVFGARNGKTKVLKPKDIAAIIQQNGLNTIFTFSLETYTCLGTLKALYEPLDKQDFFKANKNAVIHRNAVSEVEPREDTGLNVSIKPYYDQAVGISHHERKAFTTWYTKPIKSLGKLIMLPL
ncbi:MULTISPECIES: LytTR family DNA-binding domain-containing protein [Olivibacter]|uniref:LytTR family DNA-binding domain-containing protein n=1 Tax=Olivibacter jilunii TaxID=985016 RepID=A0ABW6AZ85_9SPHI